MNTNTTTKMVKDVVEGDIIIVQGYEHNVKTIERGKTNPFLGHCVGLYDENGSGVLKSVDDMVEVTQ